MRAIPTTTVSILRGTTTDAYGDPVDGTTVAASGVLASLLEQRVGVTTGADDRVQQLRAITGRLPAGTDVEEGDRIRDERTGEIYVIDNVSRVQNPVVMADTRVDLRRAT